MAQPAAYKIVMFRHGESQWNQENRFTGWKDIDLSEKGYQEARRAGQVLKEAGYTFDLAHTSYLKRAIRTLWLALEEMDQMWLPIQTTWRLNERHYGLLQGLNKAETAAQHGEKQVQIWRRSYDTPPPPMPLDDPRHPRFEARYASIPASELPNCESLKDTVARVLPYWHNHIVPDIKAGKKVLIAAHGNSLRALIKYLDNVSDSEITELNVPTGVPLVYEFDKDLKPLRHFYLGDAEEIAKAQNAVANQGKSK